MAYQTIGKQQGASDSAGKLKALKLPDDLTGASFLDIGCNEGFFCLEAKQRGASKVIGIDKSAEAIHAAKKRAKKMGLAIEYICDDWMRLPHGKFDYILFASGLHYVLEPIILFDLIYNRLANDGLFILECGYMPECMDSAITRAIRKGGPRLYPRVDILINSWLRKFAVRHIQKSVRQSGDPIRRSVFHCYKWNTSVVLILGQSHAGKTTIAPRLSTDIVIRTDVLFRSRMAKGVSLSGAEAKFEKRRLAAQGNRPGNSGIAKAWKALREDKAIKKHFAQIIVDAVRLNQGLSTIAVEGYVLEDLAPIVKKNLEAQGFRVWMMRR